MRTLSPSLLAVLGAFGALSFGGSALAQETSPDEPSAASPTSTADKPSLAPTPLGKPKIDVGVPEPENAFPPRTVHRHDGFYARMSTGFVSGRTAVSTDRSTHPDYSAGGGGIALDLMIGGSPSVGFATGGALSLHGFAYGSGSGSNSVLLGPFVDGFPWASQGLHFGGQAGFAYVGTDRKDDGDDLQGYGLGASVWLGHGIWVGDDWTLGGLLRLNGALTRDSSDDDPIDPVVLSATTYDIAFMVSVLYH